MPAPTFVTAGAGETDAGGAWTYGSWAATSAVGNLLIAHLLQDGTTNGAVTGVAGSSNMESLAGVEATWTQLIGGNADGSFPIGSAAAGRQFLFLGRSRAAASNPTFAGANSSTDDLYYRGYEFTNVFPGTTIATVLENGTAGSTPNGAATSTTVADTGVTTLGADRLALNFVGITDDASGLAAFAGETGGDWTLATAIYETATGTDATLGLMQAAMPTAGTINGGTDTITSLPWGVVGFALIGTAAAAAVPRYGFVNHSNPGVL